MQISDLNSVSMFLNAYFRSRSFRKHFCQILSPDVQQILIHQFQTDLVVSPHESARKLFTTSYNMLGTIWKWWRTVGRHLTKKSTLSF